MTDEELIAFVNNKFKNCKNKINSVKEYFPKEAKEGNNFDKVFFNIMEDYVKEKLKINKHK